MITYAWRTGFDPQEERELRDMLAEAAEEDAEAGFPQVSLDQPYGDGASHLVVRLLPDDRTGHPAQDTSPLAAYLRIEPDPDGGPATARYVVRPAFRSRGISTLLLETIGLDLRAEGGWAGTGAQALRIWARGDHPAAQRMARRFRRFGVRAARRQWQLLAPLRATAQPGPDQVPVRSLAGPAEESAAAGLWHRSGRREGPPAKAEVLAVGRAADVTGAVGSTPAPVSARNAGRQAGSSRCWPTSRPRETTCAAPC
jgi:mycothiol synthase